MKHIIFRVSLICIISFFVVIPMRANAEESQFPAEVIRADGGLIQVEDVSGNRYTIDTSIHIGSGQQMHPGDKVMVNSVLMEDGSDRYFIVDVIRRGWVIALILLFVVSVVVFGKKHGIRSLGTIIVTLAIVIYGIIPLMLHGWNPLLATILGTSLAMVFTIYFVYGWKRSSHASILSILISMIGAGVLSWIFIKGMSLTGFVDDEATFLVALGYDNLDMRGLLLSAILIGTLGVLDDVVVNQISVVKELRASGHTEKKELYHRAMRVGHDHMGSVINTLFFAYAGASFPLMILFSLRQPPFDSISSIINNEIVATEIARSLIGSILLLMAVPLSTWIGIYFLRESNEK